MTTIAYHEKIIAYDSLQATDDMIIDDNIDKKIVRNGVVFFMCGSSKDIDSFIEYYLTGSGEKKDYGSHGIVVDNGELFHAYIYEKDGLCKFKINPDKPYAIGSGEEYALSVMDLGFTAVQAVRSAIKRDVYSGGRIRKYKVKI